MKPRAIHASIHLLTTNEGGRSSILLSGYRSLLRFEGTEVDFGFELQLGPERGAKGLAPGDSGNAQLSFWAVEELPILSPGQKFEIREGTHIVGHGSVLQT